MKKIMCRENVRVVFTGHTHFQNIRKYEDENGSWFYDVSTISLANPLGKMRKVTVNSDSGLCKIESIQTGVEKTGKSRSELYRQNFPGIWETLLPLAVSDYDEFINQSEGYLPSDMLGKYKIPIRFLCKKVNKMSLLSAAKLAGVKRKLTADERKAAKEIPLKQVVFELLSHVFTGNAEFTPERIEYKVINGVLKKADGTLREIVFTHPLTAADIVLVKAGGRWNC